MEDNKDFEKEQMGNQGTRQMPGAPNGNDGSEGKKPTVRLFGHEFGKKKAVMAGLGGLLALALVGGGVVYSVGRQPQPTVAEDEASGEWVVQLGAKADGWVRGESSPVIAHIVNEAEGIDYYHAYDANDALALPVPAEGGYEVSLIAPVNADGSTYRAPDAGKAQAEAGNHNKMLNLPYTFETVRAEDVKAEDISGLIASVSDAVKKGDETLTGENGVKVVELVERNLKANPNADAEQVEEEVGKAAETAQATPPADKGNGSGDAGTSGNTDGGSNSGSGGSGSKPSHTHNWVAQTQTVHHDAQYQTVHHDAEYKIVHHDAVTKGVCVCNGCGAQFDNEGAWGAHSQEHFFDGCQSYHTSNVVVQPAWDEQVLVKDAWDEQVLVGAAWDETITTGYKCSSCGAAK